MLSYYTISLHVMAKIPTNYITKLASVSIAKYNAKCPTVDIR